MLERIKYTTIGFIIGLVPLSLQAQLPLSVGPLFSSSNATFTVNPPTPQFGLAPANRFEFSREKLIPEYIQENPMQYSYLCRLEKTIESKFPIGLWFKLEENNFQQTLLPQAGNAYIRMKMIRF